MSKVDKSASDLNLYFGVGKTSETVSCNLVAASKGIRGQRSLESFFAIISSGIVYMSLRIVIKFVNNKTPYNFYIIYFLCQEPYSRYSASGKHACVYGITL